MSSQKTTGPFFPRVKKSRCSIKINFAIINTRTNIIGLTDSDGLGCPCVHGGQAEAWKEQQQGWKGQIKARKRWWHICSSPLLHFELHGEDIFYGIKLDTRLLLFNYFRTKSDRFTLRWRKKQHSGGRTLSINPSLLNFTNGWKYMQVTLDLLSFLLQIYLPRNFSSAVSSESDSSFSGNDVMSWTTHENGSSSSSSSSSKIIFTSWTPKSNFFSSLLALSSHLLLLTSCWLGQLWFQLP